MSETTQPEPAAAEPMAPAAPTHVTVYTTSWCSDCHALKAFLNAKGIPFTEVNIEDDDEAVEFVMRVNAGRRSVPTAVVGDVAASLSNFSPIKAHEFLTRAGLAAL